MLELQLQGTEESASVAGRAQRSGKHRQVGGDLNHDFHTLCVDLCGRNQLLSWTVRHRKGSWSDLCTSSLQDDGRVGQNPAMQKATTEGSTTEGPAGAACQTTTAFQTRFPIPSSVATSPQGYPKADRPRSNLILRATVVHSTPHHSATGLQFISCSCHW